MSLPSHKEIEVPLLFEIIALGGKAKPASLFPRVVAHFCGITGEDLSQEVPSRNENLWTNRVRWTRNMLANKGEIDRSVSGTWTITQKGRDRVVASGVTKPPAYPFDYRDKRVVRMGAKLQVPPKSSPPPPGPQNEKPHDRIKKLMVEIGGKLGYHTETEQGPQYRHDVLWKQGQYKSPCVVIEVCDGGSLPKDFDSLHWASELGNWDARGILVTTDEKDFEKACKRFSGKPGLVAVKAETIEALHKMVSDNNEFLRIVFDKGN